MVASTCSALPARPLSRRRGRAWRRRTALTLALVVSLGWSAPALAAPPVVATAGALAPGASPAAGTWVVIGTDRAAAAGLLAGLGGVEVLYRYRTAVDGFAAVLSAAQVRRLAGDPRAALVEPSARQRLAGVTGGPRGLDDGLLPGREEAWDIVGGADNAGRGTVVGFVDTGLWPESPSFAPRPVHQGQRATVPGSCPESPGWPATTCTDKIVAARWFVAGFGQDSLSTQEELSPRDVDGHGTEVAALAVGDSDVRASAARQSLGTVSGTAPGASAAVYKACWTAPDPAGDGCSTPDVVAAVDTATADDVDVLVYGAAGAGDSGAVSRALLGAQQAGVVPVVPAGNDGVDSRQLTTPVPWGVIAGASRTLARPGTLVLGDGARLAGTMVSDTAVEDTRLVRGAVARLPGSTVADARLCRPGSLDPDTVDGAVVLCLRGPNPRVEKSATVAAAGGVAMVLGNAPTGPDDTPADLHSVPTLHLDRAGARAVKTWSVTHPRGTVSLDPESSMPLPAPSLAAFSARTSAADARVMAPDVLAPGVDLLTATSPREGRDRWAFVSGTSYAAAQLGGVAAYVRGARPAWGPGTVISALVSTSYQVLGDPSPLAQGGGLIDPSRVTNPGLAVGTPEPGFRDYLQGRRRPGNLDVPSLVLGDVAATTRVTRTLTNVGTSPGTWSFAASGVPGYRVRAVPSTITLPPGASTSVRIRVVPVPGSQTWSGGRLEWQSTSAPAVRLPVALRSTELVQRPRRQRGPQAVAATTSSSLPSRSAV